MSKQPNILVICSDEHHPRFSGYRGHPHVKTPNFDLKATRRRAKIDLGLIGPDGEDYTNILTVKDLERDEYDPIITDKRMR